MAFESVAHHYVYNSFEFDGMTKRRVLRNALEKRADAFGRRLGHTRRPPGPWGYTSSTGLAAAPDVETKLGTCGRGPSLSLPRETMWQETDRNYPLISIR